MLRLLSIYLVKLPAISPSSLIGLATTSVGARLAGLCLLCSLMFGCWRIGSRDAVTGYYELGDGPQKISLEIRPDGTYLEIVVLRGAVADHRSGKWRWSPGFVDFDSLWIPREFAPDYILPIGEFGRQ
jgi:hypothetical protein